MVLSAMLHLLFFNAEMNAQVTGLSVDVVVVHDGSLDPSLDGFTTYRIYANTTSELDFVSAVYGDALVPLSITSTGTIFQAAPAVNADFGHEVDPALYGSYPALEYDSWMTIGAESNSVSFNISGLWGEALSAFNNGFGIVFDDAIGNAWFSTFPCSDESDVATCAQGDPRFGGDDNRVLVAQITTNGALSGVLNIQVFEQANQGLVQEAEGLTFSTNVAEIFGCTEEGAVNYNENATADDGSCVYPCDLSIQVLNVSNEECDANSAGLIQVLSNGAQGYDFFFLDALPQGAFDNPTDYGGQNFGNFNQLSAGVYTVFVIDNAGCVDSTVVEVPSWIYDCDGTCLIDVDAVGTCGGDCAADVDSDGICDDVDDCVGLYDECGVCNGDGICLEPCEGPCWSDDISDCSTWTFGNGSGETGQPWTGIDLNFECSTVGPSGPYNQWAGGGSPAPGINSTTGGNGFLLVDSDEFGSVVAYDANWVENSWVQTSQPIDLLAHQNVKIVFETRYRCWDNGASDGSEKCFVEFSRDGVTWPTLTQNYATNWESEGMVNYDGEFIQCRYEVFAESETGFQTDDPSVVELNVSEAAGNQSEVWVRFRWVGTWGYSWEIDDIAIYEIPANDLRIDDYLSYTNYLQTGVYEYGAWPLSQIPSNLQAGAKVNNVGLAGQSNVELNLEVADADYTSEGLSFLGEGDVDTMAVAYQPNGLGVQTLNYLLSADATDEVPDNNVASQFFEVTEYQFGRDNGVISGAFPSAGTNDFIAMPLFDIVNDAVIYGIDVAIFEGSEVGSPVRTFLVDMFDDQALAQQYGGEVASSSEEALVGGFTNSVTEEVIWYTILFDEPYEASAGEWLGAAFEHFGGGNVQVAEAQSTYPQTTFAYGPFGAGSAYDWYYANEVPMVRLNLNPNAVPTGGAAGCTDSTACNYDPTAVVSSGSCVYADDVCEACIDGGVFLWDADGDGVCDYDEIAGCTDETACNFDPQATEPAPGNACLYAGDPCDDGNPITSGDAYTDSCACEGESTVVGCINPIACNYNPDAVESDGSCLFPGDPCDDGDETTAGDTLTDSCTCEGESIAVGCINPIACNYNPDAVESDGSCLFPGDPCDDGDESTTGDTLTDSCACEGESLVVGCINPIACNYNSEAVESDGSCLFPGDPCDDGDEATTGDTLTDSCACEGESIVVGCINPIACNYNPDAVESDGSCLFPGDPCDDGNEATSDDLYSESCDCEGEETSGTREDDLVFALYPNPVKDWLNVTLETGTRAELNLFDLTGRHVEMWSATGPIKLDLRPLPAGQYILSIQSERGLMKNETISVLSKN